MQKIENTQENPMRRIAEFFSLKGVFALRNVIVMSMMVAISVVLAQFSIYVTPTFRAISFSYLPGAVVAMLFGPWAALVYGFVSDTVKFIVRSSGVYFPGYALSEMLSYFIYACFFYRQPIKIWKVVAARVLILITIVFGLNYLWNSIMFGTIASKYFSGVRVINNLAQFPLHAALITAVTKAVEKQRFFGAMRV